MSKIMLIPLLSFFLIASPLPFAQQISDNSISEIIKKISQEIDCKPNSKDPKKTWCIVTQIEKGDFNSPTQDRSYLGLSVEAVPGLKLADTFPKSLRLAVLHLGSKEARITDLRPSNEQEKKQLGELQTTLEKVLGGENKTIQISSELSTFLKSEIQKPKHPLTLAKGGAYFKATHPAKIVKVKTQTGEVYVVIEQPEGGYFISLFPIKNY